MDVPRSYSQSRRSAAASDTDQSQALLAGPGEERGEKEEEKQVDPDVPWCNPCCDCPVFQIRNPAIVSRRANHRPVQAGTGRRKVKKKESELLRAFT